MKILICYGTRPEYIKIKPLLKVLNGAIPFKTLFTGQHSTLIGEHNPDFTIEIKDGSNRLDSIVQSLLNCNEEIFKDITHVLVQGDTTSAFAMCLSAFHRKIKIIHLEAGLRTHTIHSPYPEEANRQLISRLSDINLCPTNYNLENLLNESCPGESYVVGNTGLDNLKTYKNKISYNDTIIVTLHRRENHEIIEKYFRIINNLANSNDFLKFIIPIHPNPNVIKHSHILDAQNINVCEPIAYNDMLNLISNCRFIISDSGGIQEEAAFLNKRVIICRESTERPEGLSSNFHTICKTPDELKNIFELTLNNYIPDQDCICPFGDGYASEKILSLLLSKSKYSF